MHIEGLSFPESAQRRGNRIGIRHMPRVSSLIVFSTDTTADEGSYSIDTPRVGIDERYTDNADPTISAFFEFFFFLRILLSLVCGFALRR